MRGRRRWALPRGRGSTISFGVEVGVVAVVLELADWVVGGGRLFGFARLVDEVVGKAEPSRLVEMVCLLVVDCLCGALGVSEGLKGEVRVERKKWGQRKRVGLLLGKSSRCRAAVIGTGEHCWEEDERLTSYYPVGSRLEVMLGKQEGPFAVSAGHSTATGLGIVGIARDIEDL